MRLDRALAILWSSCVTFKGIRGSAECRDALPHLRELAQCMLCEKDFVSMTTLQRSATGAVEVVRCKLDRQLYVLKSALKGVARRESTRFSPVFEGAILAQGAHSLAPSLLASFQSPGSVHIVMEYFPAGDLDSLLQSAAHATESYPGKSAGSGLLQEEWVRRYAVDIVACVGWIHSLGFVHR